MECAKCVGFLVGDDEDGVRCVNCGFRPYGPLRLYRPADPVRSSRRPSPDPSREYERTFSEEHKRRISEGRRRSIRS